MKTWERSVLRRNEKVMHCGPHHTPTWQMFGFWGHVNRLKLSFDLKTLEVKTRHWCAGQMALKWLFMLHLRWVVSQTEAACQNVASHLFPRSFFSRASPLGLDWVLTRSLGSALFLPLYGPKCQPPCAAFHTACHTACLDMLIYILNCLELWTSLNDRSGLFMGISRKRM